MSRIPEIIITHSTSAPTPTSSLSIPFPALPYPITVFTWVLRLNLVRALESSRLSVDSEFSSASHLSLPLFSDEWCLLTMRNWGEVSTVLTCTVPCCLQALIFVCRFTRKGCGHLIPSAYFSQPSSDILSSKMTNTHRSPGHSLSARYAKRRLILEQVTL